jgi:hypothetical protein
VSKINELVNIRDLNQNDESFIYSSWLRSYRNSPQMKTLSNDVYYSNHKRVVESLLKNSTVKILCSVEDPSHIFGFFSYSNNILHFLYVKYNYRKMGLATHLFSECGFTSDNTLISTHTPTNSLKEYLDSKYNIKYNPYLIMHL